MSWVSLKSPTSKGKCSSGSIIQYRSRQDHERILWCRVVGKPSDRSPDRTSKGEIWGTESLYRDCVNVKCFIKVYSKLRTFMRHSTVSELVSK